jgi:hypothetical protein
MAGCTRKGRYRVLCGAELGRHGAMKPASRARERNDMPGQFRSRYGQWIGARRFCQCGNEPVTLMNHYACKPLDRQ